MKPLKKLPETLYVFKDQNPKAKQAVMIAAQAAYYAFSNIRGFIPDLESRVKTKWLKFVDVLEEIHIATERMINLSNCTDEQKEGMKENIKDQSVLLNDILQASFDLNPNQRAELLNFAQNLKNETK